MNELALSEDDTRTSTRTPIAPIAWPAPLGSGPIRSNGQKHHYVPVFYLRQWAVHKGRLCEFSRPRKAVVAKMKYPDATGYLRGLNTFARLRPELADFLENRFFRTVDNQAALVLQMLLQDKVDFDQKMQCAWSRFLMTLLHRHPEGMKRIGGKVAAGFPGELEDAVRASYARLRQDGDPATYEEFRSTITDADIDQVHLLVLHKVMDSENVGTVLNRLRWAVIQIDDTHHRLLTSDRPMLMTNGLAQADAHILMPISPNRIFVAARNVGVVRQIHAKIEHRGGVQVLNNHIVRQARSYVYAIDEAALPFMEHRLGEQAKSSPLD